MVPGTFAPCTTPGSNDLDQPVTGGVKTPTTPMRGLVHFLCATGAKLTMPAFVAWSFARTTPCLFVCFVRSVTGPLSWTRIPAAGFPCCETRSVSSVVRPTKIDLGETAIAVQNCTGGLNTPRTAAAAAEVLFAVFDSGSIATAVAVFVKLPVAAAVVTTVIVTTGPTVSVPRSQLTAVPPAPPVQVPCVVPTETNVRPAGSGSAIFTPVAVSGPLLRTSSVHVIWPPSETELGLADFTIATSIDFAGTTGAAGGGGGGVEFVVTVVGVVSIVVVVSTVVVVVV